MKKLRFPAALIVAAAILMRPEAAVSGAQYAMRVWYASVAPSLFPFLVLMPLLTGPEACAVYDSVFGRIMRPVFHLNGSAASAMIVSMLAGSPCGAMAVCGIAAQGSLSGSEARRLALAVCGVSPAFLIFGVGEVMFRSAGFGIRLAAAQLAAQLLLLFAMRDAEFEGKEVESRDLREISPIRSAVETIICICGYMTFFSATARVAAGFLNETAGRILLMAVDLPSGLNVLSQMRIPGRLLIAGAITGFGGLCIGMQNMDNLKRLGIRPIEYFLTRLIASGISGCICAGRGSLPGLQAADGRLNMYALSSLSGLVASIPVLIFLSRKFFLNNPKIGRKPADLG